MFGGGSYALISELFSPARMHAVDINKTPLPHLESFVASRRGHGYSPGVSQTDEEALEEILLTRLGGVLDMVVDDASHFYEKTLKSFEFLFPLLSSGGIYIVEDWAWAHGKRYQDICHPLYQEPSLSNLLLEVVLLCGSSPMIKDVFVHRSLFVVRKGDSTLDIGDAASLFDNIRLRGRDLQKL